MEQSTTGDLQEELEPLVAVETAAAAQVERESMLAAVEALVNPLALVALVALEFLLVALVALERPQAVEEEVEEDS